MMLTYRHYANSCTQKNRSSVQVRSVASVLLRTLSGVDDDRFRYCFNGVLLHLIDMIAYHMT